MGRKPTPGGMNKPAALKLGAHGLAVPQSGLRPESFTYLRAGGKPVRSLPITIVVWPDGTRHIQDGRHRITIARELGQLQVVGRMLGYGPRGGIRWRYRGPIPI
jgi:hypothetical protein